MLDNNWIEYDELSSVVRTDKVGEDVAALRKEQAAVILARVSSATVASPCSLSSTSTLRCLWVFPKFDTPSLCICGSKVLVVVFRSGTG